MPLGDEFNSSFVQIFSWVDLAFLVFFFGEYAGHILVDGVKYFRRTDGTWEKLYIVDATTVVMSLVLSSLNAAKVIDTQLSIFRMFRLLRLLKVAIAIQRVKGRTAKFRNKGASAQAAPPECNWVDAGTRCYDAQHNKLPAPTAKYSAFLSHYKMEAAADARYLEQHLEAMTKTNVFIDSNDLVDLEKIFEEGVLKSEMIVLLGTTGVLTRPWCLLELYEARRHHIPVVTFAMSAHAFTPASARAHMDNLQPKLPDGAEQLIREYLAENPLPGGSPDSWERFVELVTEAVDPTGDGAARLPIYQEWHNMGADEQVKAEMKALVTSMARVTHRRLEWTESEPEEAEVEPRSWKDVLLCKGNKTPKHVMCVFESKGSSAARVLQGGLQPKLGRPLLLSGQWSANYHELAEARNKLDATQLGGTPEEIAEAEQKMRAVRLKVSEHIEDAVSIGVRGCTALVVLLTPRVWTCPLTLLEVFTALQNQITVVPVVVASSGYDFATVPAQLEELAARIEEQMGAGPYKDLVELLALRGVSMHAMKTLLKKLPKLIAVTMEIAGKIDASGRTSASPTKDAADEADANEGFTAVIVNRCLKKK